MSTVKLYERDAYQTRFTATVLSCTQDAEHWNVILDQTCFYAEGGGQPADTGLLGGRRVLAVQANEEDETVVHTVAGPLEGTVEGQIDWSRRWDHTVQHTGQHLLSGAFEQLMNAETISWHLGSDSCTVDLDIESLTPEQAERIERECNRVVQANLPIVIHEVDGEGVKALPLRKPPKVTGVIRVVEILGYDWSGCGGTHVHHTGELGFVKIKSWERYKKSTRVSFLVGSRALDDYLQLDRITRELCRSLSIGVPDLPLWVQRTQDEASALRKQIKALQEKFLEAEAAELVAGARKIGGVRVVRMLLGGRTLDEVKLLAAKVAAHPASVAVFGTKGAIPQIVLYRSVDLRLDMGAMIRQVLPLIEGKGGGSPVQAQGGGSRPEALEGALDQVVARIAETVTA